MENNNNKKSAYGNSGKAEKSSADPTIEKAKSEINAQTDAMLREIEERRQRRTARQREDGQQIQAEEEAKARRMARRKAQEEANLTGVYPKNVPTVSSSDGVINNNAVKSEISSSENFRQAQGLTAAPLRASSLRRKQRLLREFQVQDVFVPQVKLRFFPR